VHSGHSQSSSTFQSFDPATNSWTEMCLSNEDLITDEGIVFDNGEELAFGLGNISKIFSIKI